MTPARPPPAKGALAGVARPFVLLEDRLDRAAPGRLWAGAARIVRCEAASEVDAAFARIEAGLAEGLHAAGFLAYELGYALEPRLAGLIPSRLTGPLLWFGLFPPPTLIAAEALDAAFADLGPPPPITDVVAGEAPDGHARKVERILDRIGAGDLYQANLTFPIGFRFAGDPLALYGALRCRQPVAHGALVALEDASVLSVSPERFIRVSQGLVSAQPMKGTAARRAGAEDDAVARAALSADPKQRAENLMIVDLLRNDLARIGEPGTVRTPALFTPQTYPTFHALISTIEARLRPDLTLRGLMGAVFPCGSVVGAPRIAAAELIAELESGPRGVYAGAIGAITPGASGGGLAGEGEAAFSVAIRTAVIGPDGVGTYGVGGGIVADSVAGDEYAEALLKARVLTGLAEDFGLIETFRWSRPAGFGRLARHLDRLAASAAALGFAFDRPDAEARLAGLAEGWAADPRDRRVRLELARGGALLIGETAAAPAPSRPLRLCLADERLDAGDPYLRHKTTRRDAYDRAFARAAARGCDEAILLNRSGAVADASRNTLFADLGGRRLTPPILAGALPGVLRAVLIEEGSAAEGDLTLDALRRADRLFVGNSLHGLREARLVRDLDISI